MCASNRRKPADTDPSSTNNDDNNGESVSELPTNAEDRAAAAALSSLDTANKTCASENDASVPSGAVLPSAADQEALGKAMSRLELIAGVGKAGGSGAAGAAGSGKKDDKAKKSKTDVRAEEKEKAVKKVVKVAAEDVGLLVDQLDLTKVKATELLRSHEGDPIRAIHAYIAPSTPH
ncbi:uncharacterized protein PADG_03115 [Paracoccidioides brasiliensis Pb18]|uniref:Nascent polypeptide-associated complex subunit alpha-like UBA domain-containing protein n=2 Tax=Paracoccidioides brasiliensis TaxID=121759 RepID=C1G7G0_PARBD|nr:uncharacterized protein PADG_03115 [Paracoccidioides brasiliensis Pb18]EEH47017.1 hypothetical protein PADG_03115 [Paracoccidioides brasiliensis Pb18]ODH19892.1 hypothetical protein ACO22_06062 [Paracoccidioides brasiliensis]